MNKKLSIILLLSCVGNILSMNSFGSNCPLPLDYRPSSIFESQIGINLILCEDWKGLHQLNTLFGVHTRHTLPSVQAASASCPVEPSNDPLPLSCDLDEPNSPAQLPVSSSHNQETKDDLRVRFFCLGGGQNSLDEAPSCLKDLGANLPSDCHVSSKSRDLKAVYTFTAAASKLHGEIVAFLTMLNEAPSKKEQIEKFCQRINQLKPMSECFSKFRTFESETDLKALVTCTDDISKLSGEIQALLSIVNEAQLREQSKKKQRETAIRNALEAQTQAKFEHDSAKIEYDEARGTVQEFEEALDRNTRNRLSKETFGRQFAEAQQIASAAQQKLLATSLSLETANENVKKANSRQ